MPREIVTVSVGQCGNQVNHQFWKTLINDHLHSTKETLFDSSMSSFFKNYDHSGNNISC